MNGRGQPKYGLEIQCVKIWERTSGKWTLWRQVCHKVWGCVWVSVWDPDNSRRVCDRLASRLFIGQTFTFGKSVVAGNCSKSFCRRWPLTRSFGKSTSKTSCLTSRCTLDAFILRRSRSLGVGSLESFCKSEHGEHCPVETQMVYFTHDSLIRDLPGVSR
jgi:hypothetical protein